jgi:hypothetical protein
MAFFVLDFPFRDKSPTLTFALQSIEIRNDFGLASEDLLNALRFLKIASVSGIFFSGLIFNVFLKYILID